MINTKTNNSSAISLAELKERIYKTLGEYSINGEHISDSSYEKVDMENRIIDAINTAVTRGIQYLPVFTHETNVYFPYMKYLCFKENISLQENERLCLECANCNGKIAIRLCANGKLSVKASVNGTTVMQEQLLETQFSKLDTHILSFECDNCAYIEITALEKASFIDSVYALDVSGFENEDLCFLPEYNQTFAKADSDIQKITYAVCRGKSIPVYEYKVKDGYVYTNCKNEGKTIFHYLPKVREFTNESGEDEQLCLPEITICAIIYLAASELCTTGDADVYNRLSYNYRDIVQNCYDRQRDYKRNGFFTKAGEKLAFWR